MPFYVTSATFNSLGHNILKEKLGWVKFNENKIPNILKYDVLDSDWKKFYKYRNSVTRLISLIRATNSNINDWELLAEKYDIDYPSAPEFPSILTNVWTTYLTKTKVIDFDDQIYRCVSEDLITPFYDRIFVDEVQDLNEIQQIFLQKLLKPSGRLVSVGDRYQSIYGFRGADTFAVDNVIKRFGSTCLPLSICYRCGTDIVAEAKKVVPSIEPFEGNEKGVVDSIGTKAFDTLVRDGDFVLCRTSAPLVQSCLSMIRQGRRAFVRGRDIGDATKSLIEVVAQKGDTVSDMLNRLEEHVNLQTQRLSERNQDSLILALTDKADTIKVIAEGYDSLSALYNRIDSLFSDSLDSGIMFSTAHKAKGLETDNVFLIEPELMPHKKAKKPWQQEQERNLKFVTITRAKKSFYYVTKS